MRIKPNADSNEVAVSGSGQVVAFVSYASNLDPRDADGWRDVYVFDTAEGKLEVVSHPRTEPSRIRDMCQGFCGDVSVDHDGNLVAFTSLANDLVPEGTNAFADVFIVNRSTDQVTLVSKAATGEPSNAPSWFRGSQALSSDGRFMAFLSQATNLIHNGTAIKAATNCYVYDRQTESITLVNVDADGRPHAGDCFRPAIDSTGKWVAFSRMPEGGAALDIWLYDASSRRATAVTGTGTAGNSWLATISANGSFVGFASEVAFAEEDEDTIVDVYIYSRGTGEVRLVSGDGWEAFGGQATVPLMTSDGETVLFLWERPTDEPDPWRFTRSLVGRYVRDIVP